MIRALESVFSVIFMIGLGFVLARRGWFEGKSGALLSRIVIGVSLPAYMISNLMGGYDRGRLLGMLTGLPVPYAVLAASYALAYLLAVLFRVPAERRGVFTCQFAQSNTIFIGLPVNMVLFGDTSLPYVLMAYIANTTVFWTAGVHGLARDGALRTGRKAPSIFSKEGLKRIMSPPLVAMMSAILLILAGVRLPRVALDTCRTLGALTTPLSMLFVGIVIAKVEWKSMRIGRDMLLILAGRLVAGPLALVLIARPLALPLLMKQVFLIQAAMPSMTQVPIMAEAAGADGEYAALSTSLSTVAGLVGIPAWMMLVDLVFA